MIASMPARLRIDCISAFRPMLIAVARTASSQAFLAPDDPNPLHSRAMTRCVVIESPAWMSIASARLTFLSSPSTRNGVARPMISEVAALAAAWSRDAGTDGPGPGNATRPMRSSGWRRSMKRRAASMAPRAPKFLKLPWSMARKISRP